MIERHGMLMRCCSLKQHYKRQKWVFQKRKEGGVEVGDGTSFRNKPTARDSPQLQLVGCRARQEDQIIIQDMYIRREAPRGVMKLLT